MQGAPGWQKLKPENGIFTFLAPDNFSSFLFRAQPVSVNEADCQQYAEDTVKDTAYTIEKKAKKGERDDPSRGTDTEVMTEAIAHDSADPASVHFRLRIVDHKSIYPDRIVLGRTLSRPAGLAVAYCTLTEPRSEQLTPACEEMLASVVIADRVAADEAKLAYDADTLTMGVARQ